VGLVIDTDVLVLADRRRAPLDLGRWREHGSAYLSAVTASELLVGVHRAQTDGQRNRRNAFVESLLAAIPILPFDLECARIHAQLVASLPRSETIGAHDALIAATALRHGHSVLTNNGRDFRKLAGVAVVDYLGSGDADASLSNAPAVSRVVEAMPEAVEFDRMKCWGELEQLYMNLSEEVGSAKKGGNRLRKDLDYLDEAYKTTEGLWRGQFEKMDRVLAVVLSEAPLFGRKKRTYFYNPKAKPTSFFYFNDAEAVAGKGFADGQEFESAQDRKQFLIDTLTRHGVLIIDLFPYALNPDDTAVNYRSLPQDHYVKLFRESARIWLRPRLDAVRRKAANPKFLFRYKRVQDRLGQELRQLRLLRQDDEVTSIYGKNMALDRKRLADILGVH